MAGTAAFALALALPAGATAHDFARGYVYTETNAASGNQILAYARQSDGSLTQIGTFATDGRGTGSGLATQGEVILTGGGRYLLAVNAGSNDISTFRVRDDGRLELTDRTGAAGTMPVSLTEHRGVVYALDAGGAGNIAGFRLGRDGDLDHIYGSVRPLSGSGTNPAEIGFSSDGRTLLVTERATNLLDTYAVDWFGRAFGPRTTASAGPTPYGFAFDHRDHAIVSEAANSTLSSYAVHPWDVRVITASAPTFGAAACWVAVTPNGRWAFDTNAHSGTISSFSIGFGGRLTLGHAVAANTGAGSAPLDLEVSSDGSNLYVLESGTHVIGGFRLMAGGALVPVPGGPAVPASSSGIAVS